MIETTSLELSKKLEPILSGEIDNFFAWEYTGDDESGCVYELVGADDAMGSVIPAYTACELMKVLPAEIDGGSLTLWTEGKMWDVDYPRETIQVSNSALEKWFGPMQETPAEALGEMVLWLHGEGLLK